MTMWIAAGISLGVLGGYVGRKYWAERKITRAETRAKQIVAEAEERAARTRRELDMEVRERYLKLRTDFEQETKDRREQLQQQDERAHQREENLERKADLMAAKEQELVDREQLLAKHQTELGAKQQELARLIVEARGHLARVSRLSPDEARRQYLAQLEGELKQETSQRIQAAEVASREQAEARARALVMESIQRCASEQAATSTVTVVRLPSDELKGRIIGRDGRNIRTFQMLTGVDVIVDETPEAVVLSGFDPIRREIARMTLEKLIGDGRISPTRIEEVVEEAKQDLERVIVQEGEQAAAGLEVFNLHAELVKLVGRLRFHLTYGQNILAHAKETAQLLGTIATELKLDPALARRIGLLHDLGKAVAEEQEGTHAQIGAELARQYGESAVVVNAIQAHHQEVEPQSEYATLAQICCAISAQRPGVRRENLDAYIKRLEKLERIADGFSGVDRSYAIQTGREIQVLVRPDQVQDIDIPLLARQIAKRIQEDLQYPGQIKVTVIRETKAVEYTKA